MLRSRIGGGAAEAGRKRCHCQRRSALSPVRTGLTRNTTDDQYGPDVQSDNRRRDRQLDHGRSRLSRRSQTSQQGSGIPNSGRVKQRADSPSLPSCHVARGPWGISQPSIQLGCSCRVGGRVLVHHKSNEMVALQHESCSESALLSGRKKKVKPTNC